MTVKRWLLRAVMLLLIASRSAAQEPGSYILGPNDQVLVSIYGQTDRDTRTRIKADGSITLPLVGSIAAAGRDTSRLASEIEGQLRTGGYIRNPIVNVEIVEYTSRTVTVLGFVGTPGVYPLDHSQTVGAMIARAGGIREGGSDAVTLRHNQTGAPERISVAAVAQDAARDMVLRPGDVIYVGEVERFYIYGQVNAPGTYPVTAGMTLRQALARGGGPTLAGTERRITLYRHAQQPAEADLDGRVQPGDVLLVRERSF